MQLPNKIYNILKYICLIALPACSWLYSQLSTVWNLPYGQQIPQTISMVATFLGILIGVSTYKYNKIQNGINDTQSDSE